MGEPPNVGAAGHWLPPLVVLSTSSNGLKVLAAHTYLLLSKKSLYCCLARMWSRLTHLWNKARKGSLKLPDAGSVAWYGQVEVWYSKQRPNMLLGDRAKSIVKPRTTQRLEDRCKWCRCTLVVILLKVKDETKNSRACQTKFSVDQATEDAGRKALKA